MIKIDDSMRNGLTYGGNTLKFGVTIDGKAYLVKGAKDNELSVYCEYIASNFIRAIGISCQQVYLGNYNGKDVDVIYDFAYNNGMYLHSFKDTKQSSVDTNLSDKEYTYDDVVYLISKHIKLSDAYKEEAIKMFWKMFICDAVLGNRDRHWGNWGYLGVNGSNKYRPAPIYDNGASLFPGVYRVISQMNIDREKFLYDRIYTVPASVFRIRRPDRTYKSNFYDMFSDLRINRVFAEEVKSIKEKFSPEIIFHTIVNIVCSIETPIDTNIKLFWIQIVTMRYLCIICRYTFNKALSITDKMMESLL